MDQKFREAAEGQIIEKQKVVDYDVKEFTLELLNHKYITGLQDDTNEIFIPSYQRKFVWDQERQAKFIESILLGLPIPYIFTADIDNGRLEVVDGSQRLRTINNFLENRLVIKNLDVLTKLNGFSFNDLTVARQRRFKNSTIRMISLSEKSDDEIRFMMFERINTGSMILKDMEKRQGIFGGKFIQFVKNKCATHPLYKRHTEFTETMLSRGEDEELIIRFFAFSDRYRVFKSGVNDFLNDYTDDSNKKLEKDRLLSEFERMLEFVDKFLDHGFLKKEGSKKTPRVRFEALSVGINLALREKPDLINSQIDMSFIENDEFVGLTTGGSHNVQSNVIARIEYVRDKLLSQ
ncbi:DUF262 domain-containing protein [Phaeocystidibacter marisrubri]|uniref:DUF262 domain-containing protein n=1 Tax=Phaeocystidibacter marisrubri TaxID=1577780 RepID=A0A6L3ZFB0_9FLAO|nr:DUF262 domain-containing protein [Phaeocystidibacter marisrubri]KAB2816102.1 DUF262 domain-containing protein [Phaeocystidibacter marisrubri]GGH67337.1 hypothetical protein GCM10011318_06210 [Phaeocystidibacter marisrubri]